MAADLPVTEPGRVIASPYTRTLQTAAILSTRWGFPLFVDMALHDWLPVRDGRIPMSGEVVAEKIREYEQWRRTGVASATRTWETDMEMRERLLAAVERHRRRDTLVLVTHEAVIRSATGVADVPLASRHVLNSDG